MIQLKNVSKRYGNHILLENITENFDSQKIKIKGENGIGKSVLLKLIVGYSIPDEGSIYYDGKELGKDTDFLEDAGVSINAPQFMPNWTGRENLKYLQEIRKVCSNKRLNHLINTFELENDIDKKYKTYSLGMCQKMRIIQALMDKPKYLILDEPFDALSFSSKAKAKGILESYLSKDPQRTLIYTSHSEEDDVFANRIYLIKEYHLTQIK